MNQEVLDLIPYIIIFSLALPVFVYFRNRKRTTKKIKMMMRKGQKYDAHDEAEEALRFYVIAGVIFFLLGGVLLLYFLKLWGICIISTSIVYPILFSETKKIKREIEGVINRNKRKIKSEKII